MTKRFYRTVLLMLGAAIIAANAPSRAENAEDLRVSDNGRFLIHADGSKFFPVADTAWAIAWKLTRGEVEYYVQHRKDQQFNTLALVSFPSYDGLRIVANAYEDLPFAVNNGVWDPAQPLATPGSDPENPDEYDYWDHLEYVIDTAAAKNMCVVLLPAWGCYVAGSYLKGEPSKEIIFDAAGAYVYGNWMGRRFGTKKNILWMMGGDRSAVYGERDYREVFRSMAEGVADGVNGIDQHDARADYSTTLMSYHPRKWHPNSSEWFHHDPWLDFNSMQDQPKDQIAATELDYGRSPAKPTWLFEGGYEFRTRGGDSYKDWQIRFQSYQTVFAGGFGITYGSMNVFHFGGDLTGLDEKVATAEISAKWAACLDEAGAVDMQHLHALMSTLSDAQYIDRIPDQSLIDGDQGAMDAGEGTRSSRLQATRGAKGDYAMIYTANGRSIRVKMELLAPPHASASWFNPRNGAWAVGEQESTEQQPFLTGLPTGPGAPIQEFDPPGAIGEGNDWVLVLKESKS